MYFPSDVERKKLIKSLLPESRTLRVDESLRGWNWNSSPLQAPFDVSLANYEVASYYCPTGRDLFLRRVRGVKVPPNEAMIEGIVLHEVVSQFIVRAKRELYLAGVGRWRDALRVLETTDPRALAASFHCQDPLPDSVLDKAGVIWHFELDALTFRVQQVLSEQPYIDDDSLVAMVLPFAVEQKLDGSFLGLSTQLSCDAFRYFETIVLDLKFGDPRPFHRLATTGYALVLEALYEYPVNVGCIVYPTFVGDRLIVRRDYHLIDDELRQWFIEARDEKMRMIFDEIDPGLPSECYETCPFLKVCNPAKVSKNGRR